MSRYQQALIALNSDYPVNHALFSLSFLWQPVKNERYITPHSKKWGYAYPLYLPKMTPMTVCLPMTESVVGAVLLPNAHMHLAPPGTWNRQKLHWLLKYFGRKLADAKLQTEFTSEQFNTNVNYIKTWRSIICDGFFIRDVLGSQSCNWMMTFTEDF